MTEQEAMIRFDFIRCALLAGTKPEIIPSEDNVRLIDMAIKALEEIQKYRAIGTVEEIKQQLSELERWHTTEINPKIKNVFANTSTQICHNCDHKDEYIEELEAEMEEYLAIGTPEECRVAVEKQKAKKPIIKSRSVYDDDNGDYLSDEEYTVCPSCNPMREVYMGWTYCRWCGQKIDWSDEE